ncbi:porin [Algoriphagus sediminis]|uniref:Porin n=1 Tax=Algoriphagus sediminis TaxID=3057113 RepID=A0ABT7YE44_9BACT|nr:porin [Algoriphagus sediminis]MDN3204797.1 porin [Algoriphagus sediminis]
MPRLFSLIAIFLLVNLFALAQDKGLETDSLRLAKIRHTSKGFVFTTYDGNYELQIAARLQFRFATPDDQNPLNFDDFTNQNTRLFKINRSRLKIGGHAFQPWLKYFLEYELGQGNLLDFRVMVEKVPWLKFKAGQWKVEFTRERFISSGNQQLVDRSLINRAFTVDRQQGVTLYGNIDAGGIANFNYWTAILTGTGRGATTNDDNKLMYFGRVQWNFLGREVPFSGGDLDFSPASGLIAFAAVTNTSPYTRFSQEGGGALEGFEDGLPGQYTINQYQIETAFYLRGFSWSSEFHRKHIIDNLSTGTTTLGGYYIQAGLFPFTISNFFPKKLEIASRFARYRPDLNIEENNQTEVAFAVNWFFNGHKNKLTAEITRFTFQDLELPQSDETRLRIQYDVSF